VDVISPATAVHLDQALGLPSSQRSLRRALAKVKTSKAVVRLISQGGNGAKSERVKALGLLPNWFGTPLIMAIDTVSRGV
jgi:hypothetical protein